MKLLTLILAGFVLLLTIQPGIDALSFQAETTQFCCATQCTPVSDKNSPQSQNQDNDCKSCNPFQVCSSCALVCHSILADYVPKPHIYSEKGFIHKSVFISQFSVDFWQPPKIV